MRGQKELYDVFQQLGITFDYYEHAAAYTIEDAMKNWKYIDSTHCKNLFFRNHKGDKHYLVILEYSHQLNIKDLEQRLKQGKITFASDERLKKYLGLTRGSVSPFGLINDKGKHVHLFIDEHLREVEKLSFHPNENTASVIIKKIDFEKFLTWAGNSYEYLSL